MSDLAAGSTPGSAPPPAARRQVLLVAHLGRADIATVAGHAASTLAAAGVEVLALPDEAPTLGLPVDDVHPGLELVLALGGDGTLLRAAEHARPAGVPVLGVNLGRVGFLAEADGDDLDDVLRAIADRNYSTRSRMTVDVRVEHDGEVVFAGWALNEISVEKSTRERILDVVVEVDGRGVSAYGCDGVLCATPTGSTAYAFSAGGPVLWPGVEALLVVPLNAHALFARPLVVGPTSKVTVQIDPAGHDAIAACDGRRSFVVPPGAKVHMFRGERSVEVVKLRDQPFTDRLVRKFSLPVHGWRDARH